MTGRSSIWPHSASESAWPANSRSQRPRSDSTTSARSSTRFWRSSATSRTASIRPCFASSDSGRRWPAPCGVRLHRRSSRQQRSAATPKTSRPPSTSAAWKVSRTSTSTPVWARPLSFGSGNAMAGSPSRSSTTASATTPGSVTQRRSRAGEHVGPDRRARWNPRGRVGAQDGVPRSGRTSRSTSPRSELVSSPRSEASQRLTSSRSLQGRADGGRGRPTTVGAAQARSSACGRTPPRRTTRPPTDRRGTRSR